jgi:hypothetical protein
MAALPTGLDAELVAEFADEARRNYAALLTALSQAAHPGESDRASSAAAVAATQGLCNCWQSACLLGVPIPELRHHFPLAAPGAMDLIHFLLTLAVYSENFSEDAELVGRLLRQLSKTVSADESGNSALAE